MGGAAITFQRLERWIGMTLSRDSDFDYDVDMGNGLRSARMRAQLNIGEAAAALNMSRSGYVKIERGERGMDSEFIKRGASCSGSHLSRSSPTRSAAHSSRISTRLH
jgi:Helix-turn-helix domain